VAVLRKVLVSGISELAPRGVLNPARRHANAFGIKNCDRLLAFKQVMLILVMMALMTAVIFIKVIVLFLRAMMTFLRRIGPPKLFVPCFYISPVHTLLVGLVP